jgi:pimeloyl-ACP methyl ester carboxylesterase
LDLSKPFIYGAATGARFGIAFALTYPNHVKNLYFDRSVYFSEKEYHVEVFETDIDILARYKKMVEIIDMSIKA